MIVKIIMIIMASIISGICYRLGGSAKKGNWLDFARNSKVRDIGCSLLSLGLFVGQKGVKMGSWWLYAIAFGLSWGALASYWGQDEKKWGYFWHGLGLSLALLPIAYMTGNWLGFGLRTIILTALITIISEYITKDWLEEGLRGVVIILTLPLLLL